MAKNVPPRKPAKILRGLSSLLPEMNSLMEHSRDILALYDADLNYLFINREGAEHLGFSQREIIGKTNRALLGAAADKIEIHVKKAFDTQQPVNVIHEFSTSHGIHHFESTYSPIRESSGGAQMVLGIWRDTTAVRLKLRAIEKMMEEKGEELQETTRQLTREHSFSSAILQTVNALVAVIDSEGLIIKFNSACEKLTGLTSAEAMGKTFCEIFQLADSGTCLSAICKKPSEDNTGFELESTFMRAGGARKVIAWSITMLYDASGVVDYHIATGIDITRRKEAEEELARSEEKYRSIFESFQDVYYRADLEGKIEAVSPSIAVYGFDPEKLIGHNAAQMYADPYQRDILMQKLKEKGVVNDFEINLRKKNRKVVNVSVNAHIVYGKDGQPMAVEGVLRDISDRKHAENALKESENKVRALIESAPVGIIIVTRNRTITLANAKTESIFGYNREDLIGKSVDILVPDHYREKHIAQHDKYAENPSVRPMGMGIELNGQRKDGSIIPLEIALSAVETGEGSFYICFVSDISTRKAAQEDLRLAREEFIAILTHDLKAPLASILGFADLLERSIDSEKQKAEHSYLSMIHYSGDIMLNLINNIVGASRIESGRLSFSFAIFPLEDLLEELRRVFYPLAAKQNITLDFSCPAGVRVNGDREKLRQVFHNLISNALRYTPRYKTISIRARSEGGRVHIAVADTGRGIPEAEQKKLFQKFVQVKGERKGTGLGLFIVRVVIEGHGSDVRLESEPGKGTTFFFSLEEAR
jgi:PAS domain S-box-containing protein